MELVCVTVIGRIIIATRWSRNDWQYEFYDDDMDVYRLLRTELAPSEWELEILGPL